MTPKLALAVLAAACLISAPAQARKARHHHSTLPAAASSYQHDNNGRVVFVPPDASNQAHGHAQAVSLSAKATPEYGLGGPRQKTSVQGSNGEIGHIRYSDRGDPRPHAWCGWQMRQWLNVADRNGNRAIWWARYGSNAHGPAVGVIVVWYHHVGIITGRTDTGWILKSGNDGHAIRERERSLRGAVAFRWPNQWASK